jgi:hypothetical protein
MPLGDSITNGDRMGGYRLKLFLDLVKIGFSVGFVGSLSNPDSPDPYFDTDHEGHWGWHTNQIRDNIYNWLESTPADIVLLHIGTNDISESHQDVREVEAILDNIDSYESDYSRDITVFLARIILRSDSYENNETTKDFNNAVEAMAQARIDNAGDDIIIVDMENALSYPDDLIDALHPNAFGYEKMAIVWYNAIVEMITPTLSPIADFEIQLSTTPRINETIIFIDRSSDINGTIVSWYWNFGDSTTSTVQNPIHEYKQEGAYTVILTVIDNDGLSDTTSMHIPEIIIPEFPSWLIFPLFVFTTLGVIILKNRINKTDKKYLTK